MKKILLIIISFVLIISLGGCGNMQSQEILEMLEKKYNTKFICDGSRRCAYYYTVIAHPVDNEDVTVTANYGENWNDGELDDDYAQILVRDFYEAEFSEVMDSLYSESEVIICEQVGGDCPEGNNLKLPLTAEYIGANAERPFCGALICIKKGSELCSMEEEYEKIVGIAERYRNSGIPVAISLFFYDDNEFETVKQQLTDDAAKDELMNRLIINTPELYINTLPLENDVVYYKQIFNKKTKEYDKSYFMTKRQEI